MFRAVQKGISICVQKIGQAKKIGPFEIFTTTSFLPPSLLPYHQNFLDGKVVLLPPSFFLPLFTSFSSGGEFVSGEGGKKKKKKEGGSKTSLH